MWHPHMKRTWIDDRNYLIYDRSRKVYSTSLIQLKTDTGFLDSNESSPKIQCGCRFIKEDIVSSPQQDIILHNQQFIQTGIETPPTSFLELKNDSKGENNMIAVNSYMESLNENIKNNNIIMSKIEHFLENQQIGGINGVNNQNQLQRSSQLPNIPINNQISNSNPYTNPNFIPNNNQINNINTYSNPNFIPNNNFYNQNQPFMFQNLPLNNIQPGPNFNNFRGVPPVYNNFQSRTW